MFNIGRNQQIEINLEAQSKGTLYKKYSPALSLPVQDVQYHGFHAVELKFQQHLKTDTIKDNLMFQLRLKGSPLKGKETNNTYQGKDIAISLYWAHQHNEWRIFGELQSEIIGRKKIAQIGGELETIDAYSRFGTMLGGQWLSDIFWLEAHTLFYLTTDYNSRSKSYNRITDKGYVVGGKFIVGFYLNKNSTITIEHGRSGGNFNIVPSSTTEATEYEMEIQYSQLGATWLF